MNRAVSSSRRTHAIFSSVFRAAISLLNVRMFFSSVLNLIVARWFRPRAHLDASRRVEKSHTLQSVTQSVRQFVSLDSKKKEKIPVGN